MARELVIEKNIQNVWDKTPTQIRETPQETDQSFILKMDKLITHPNVLRALQNGTFRRLVGIKGGIPATFLGRCPELDGETITDMLNIVVKNQYHQHHPLYCEFGTFIPVPGDYETSALPIPYFDEFVNMKNPFEIDWLVLTNDLKIASYRIILRNGIVNSNTVKKYCIHPSTHDLAFYLIWIFLSAAEDIAFHGSLDPSTATIGDFDDTRTRMIRVLVCLILTTCASGKIPACHAYTFINSDKIPVLKEDYWIPRRLASVLPFTGWDKDLLAREILIYKGLH
jgi:hypothetical protein